MLQPLVFYRNLRFAEGPILLVIAVGAIDHRRPNDIPQRQGRWVLGIDEENLIDDLQRLAVLELRLQLPHSLKIAVDDLRLLGRLLRGLAADRCLHFLLGGLLGKQARVHARVADQ